MTESAVVATEGGVAAAGCEACSMAIVTFEVSIEVEDDGPTSWRAFLSVEGTVSALGIAFA
jgi:hypothetical protein